MPKNDLPGPCCSLSFIIITLLRHGPSHPLQLQGAFIRFKGEDMVPDFTQFEAAPHPDVKPMKYAASMMNGMFGM